MQRSHAQGHNACEIQASVLVRWLSLHGLQSKARAHPTKPPPLKRHANPQPANPKVSMHAYFSSSTLRRLDAAVGLRGAAVNSTSARRREVVPRALQAVQSSESLTAPACRGFNKMH